MTLDVVASMYVVDEAVSTKVPVTFDAVAARKHDVVVTETTTSPTATLVMPVVQSAS